MSAASKKSCYEELETEQSIIIPLLDKEGIKLGNDFISYLKYLSLCHNKNIGIKTKEIMVNEELNWDAPYNLILISENNIIFKPNAKLIHKGSGSLYLKSGIENNQHIGKVIFENSQQKQVFMQDAGKVFIYYNPDQDNELHKYHNPYGYFKHVEPMSSVTSYMLVNDLDDLQNINLFLHGNYALSQNINAVSSGNLNSGKGFKPLTLPEENVPFTGNFDGNGYTINGLTINRPDEDSIGLFGMVAGGEKAHISIKNLNLENFSIKGDHYIGALAGEAEYADIINISLLSRYDISGKNVVGGIVGTASDIDVNNIVVANDDSSSIMGEEYFGLIVGSIENSKISDASCSNSTTELKCVGYEENLEII